MDVQKTIDFLLEQQAAAATEHAQFREELRDLREANREHYSMIQAHTGCLQGLTASLDRVVELHRMLVEDARDTRDNLNVLIRTIQDLTQRPPQ